MQEMLKSNVHRKKKKSEVCVCDQESVNDIMLEGWYVQAGSRKVAD
jgi:hypothetical protein